MHPALTGLASHSAQRCDAKSEHEWALILQQHVGTQNYLAPEVIKIAEMKEKAKKHRIKDSMHYTEKVRLRSLRSPGPAVTLPLQ